MKSILLTSTALVAFAGAAAADGHTSITFGGEATAEYNTETGYDVSAEMTATMSATLDNGLTATAEITLDPTATGDDQVTYGSVTLASDNASLTFGTGLDGAVQTAVGDDYDIGQAAEEDLDGIVGSYTMGETTLTVSMPIAEGATESDSDALEVGISTNAAGWALGLGLTGAGEYAATAEGTVAGATLNFGFASNDEWDAGIEYGIGPVTLSASTDEAEAWTVGADYASGPISAGIEYNADESWEVSAGYEAGAIHIDAALDSDEVMTVGVTYDVGSGLMVGAGMEGDDTYAFLDYDLGGNASAYVEYTDAAAELEEVGPSERDIAVGTDRKSVV